jgi:hypothetical protein
VKSSETSAVLDCEIKKLVLEKRRLEFVLDAMYSKQRHLADENSKILEEISVLKLERNCIQSDRVQLLEQLSQKFSMYNDNEKKLLNKLLLDGMSVAEYGECATNNYSTFDKLHAEYNLILSSCEIQLNAFPKPRSPLLTNTTSDSNSNVCEYAKQVQRS